MLMSWLGRKVASFIDTGREENREREEGDAKPVEQEDDYVLDLFAPKSRHRRKEAFDAMNPMGISLWKANGGMIIKFNTFDSQTETDNETVYIIGADESLESCLSKFIVQESIKHG